MGLEGVTGQAFDGAGLHGQRHEGELKIGMLDTGAAADEGAGLEMIARSMAVMGQEPLQADQPFSRRLAGGVEADRLQAAMLDDDVGMIVQVRSHARQIVAHRNADFAQMVGGPDAGELQELGRVERAAAQDHLAFGPHIGTDGIHHIGNAHRALALEQNVPGERAGDDGEVWPLRCRRQIAASHAPASAASRGAVHRTEAFLLAAIGIGCVGITGFDARADKGLGQGRALEAWR